MKEAAKDPLWSAAGEWFIDKNMKARVINRLPQIMSDLQHNTMKFESIRQILIFIGEPRAHQNNLVASSFAPRAPEARLSQDNRNPVSDLSIWKHHSNRSP